ncbi:uncharacterized protein LOC118834734 [Trichosurus vulpecula]|uniref:uncharacterized protein LOC118834734 n=1 Tax=Trichosurus vulpecula TaxID=9337 RepID=UPI00186B546A|nr:uncharacterized protein LOC118834734 [Trichosurus vulpecula]
MMPQENTSGCPSAGSVRSHPQQTQRRPRGRRPRRKNRTVWKQRAAFTNALSCLLAMIQLVTPSTAAPAILPPLAAKPTHWAVTPNLPMFQLVTCSPSCLCNPYSLPCFPVCTIRKTSSTATTFTTELHMLDEVIAAIQNATIQFNGDWEENYTNAKAWWDTLSVHQLLQWASIGGLVLILAFLICLFLPYLISCMIGVLRRSLEAVKADVIKQKGGVVRGALDLGLLKG